MTWIDEKESEAIAKLKNWLDSNELLFDGREIDTIKRMIKTYESFEAFGHLAGAARRIVMWLGFMLGAYFAFTEFVLKFLRSKLGGP